MGRPTRFSPEVREWAVRLVFDNEREYDSQWAAMQSIAEKIGCTTETLRQCGIWSVRVCPGVSPCR